MAKQKTNEQEIDEFEIMNLIAGDNAISSPKEQAVPAKEEPVPEKEPGEKKETKKETVKKKNTAPDGYKETFLYRNNLRIRQSTFISQEIHQQIIDLMKAVGKNDITIGNFIDNVLAHHFEVHKDEIKELKSEFIKNYQS